MFFFVDGESYINSNLLSRAEWSCFFRAKQRTTSQQVNLRNTCTNSGRMICKYMDRLDVHILKDGTPHFWLCRRNRLKDPRQMCRRCCSNPTSIVSRRKGFRPVFCWYWVWASVRIPRLASGMVVIPFFFCGGGVALERHGESFIYAIWKKMAPYQLRLNYTAKRLGKNKKPSKSTRFWRVRECISPQVRG